MLFGGARCHRTGNEPERRPREAAASVLTNPSLLHAAAGQQSRSRAPNAGLRQRARSGLSPEGAVASVIRRLRSEEELDTGTRITDRNEKTGWRGWAERERFQSGRLGSLPDCRDEVLRPAASLRRKGSVPWVRELGGRASWRIPPFGDDGFIVGEGFPASGTIRGACGQLRRFGYERQVFVTRIEDDFVLCHSAPSARLYWPITRRTCFT